MKRPSFQFYPGDWLRDMGLRGCSMKARGLWVDLLCLMHDGTPYGHLSTERGPWSDEQGARATGLPPGVYRQLLQELEDAGVFSRDDRGAVFSRRMVKDEEIRSKRAEAGHFGGSKTQANRQANTVADVKQMVAAATADAVGSSGKGSGENLLRRFNAADAVAVETWLGGLDAFNATTWINRLTGYLEGLDMPAGQRATPAAIATAIRDLGLGNHSPAKVRRFIERAMIPPKSITNDTKEFDQLRRKFAAEAP